MHCEQLDETKNRIKYENLIALEPCSYYICIIANHVLTALRKMAVALSLLIKLRANEPYSHTRCIFSISNESDYEMHR